MADTLEIFGTEYTGVTGIIATNDQSTDLTYIRPQGTKSITQNGTGIDVASFESVDVNVSGGGQPTLQSKTYNVSSAGTATVTADSGYDGLSEVEVSVSEATPYVYYGSQYVTQNNSRTWQVRGICDIDDEGEDHSGYIGLGTYYGTWYSYNAVPANTTVTPTESAQTIGGANYMMEGAVTVNAISSTYVGTGITRRSSSDLTASGATVTVPSGYYSAQASKAVASGTAGTPTATKGTVSNHQVAVTPSVTNTTGYISGGTKNGTAVTVTASELVSGSETKTENGTYDVTNLASLIVDVQGGGYTWEVLSDQNVTITADSPNPNYFYWTFTDPLSADETYRITWGTGGTQYICETIEDPIQFTYDGYYLGNAHIAGSSYTDTGEPFMLYRSSATRMIGLTNQSTGSWHIKIEKQVPTSATLIEKTITANGTYTATDDSADGYSKVIVNVPSGSSKNTQVVQGTTRTTSSTLTAIGAEMTVSKTGTYDVYWSAFRSSTSGSYTFGSQLFIDSVAYGTENTTWSNHVQDNHLSNVSLTANQKIRVRGRNSRGSSYYLYAPTLVIVEA